jgi:hypothetical protein
MTTEDNGAGIQPLQPGTPLLEWAYEIHEDTRFVDDDEDKAAKNPPVWHATLNKKRERERAKRKPPKPVVIKELKTNYALQYLRILLRNPNGGLTMVERNVLMNLIARHGGWTCHPSKATIAADIQVSVEMVRRALLKLRELGLVSWTTPKLGKQNVYVIHHEKIAELRTSNVGGSGD